MTYKITAKALALIGVTGALIFVQIPSPAYAGTGSSCTSLFPTGGGGAMICKTWKPDSAGSFNGTYLVELMQGGIDVPVSAVNVRVYYDGHYNRTLWLRDVYYSVPYQHVKKLAMKVCNQWYCTGLW